MADRADPMVAAAQIIVAVRDTAAAQPDARATVGRLMPVPGGTNVIASRVDMWLDARHPDDAVTARLIESIYGAAQRIAAGEGCSVSLTEESYSDTVHFDPGLTRRISGILPGRSGAGYRGRPRCRSALAAYVPSAMLFVRNPSGISHSPEEYVADEDANTGAEALRSDGSAGGSAVTGFWCESAVVAGRGPADGGQAEADGGPACARVGAAGRAGRPHLADHFRVTEPQPGDHILKGVVFPAAANAHSHAFHRILRGRTHDGRGDFWVWREQMYRSAAELTPESYEKLASAVFAEMVVAGFQQRGRVPLCPPPAGRDSVRGAACHGTGVGQGGNGRRDPPDVPGHPVPGGRDRYAAEPGTVTVRRHRRPGLAGRGWHLFAPKWRGAFPRRWSGWGPRCIPCAASRTRTWRWWPGSCPWTCRFTSTSANSRRRTRRALRLMASRLPACWSGTACCPGGSRQSTPRT